MPSGWNQKQQARLLRFFRRMKWTPAVGTWRRWSEEHVLVFGDDRKVALLARRFRQNAIVVLRVGQPARLVSLGW